MLKPFAGLMAIIAIVGIGSARPSHAQDCTAYCGSGDIRLTPGQPLRLEVSNQTSGVVRFAKVGFSDPVRLVPGAGIQYDYGSSTQPNLSTVFWDETGLSLRAVLFRPNERTLRIELRPGGAIGDRTLYIHNDGRVVLF